MTFRSTLDDFHSTVTFFFFCFFCLRVHLQKPAACDSWRFCHYASNWSCALATWPRGSPFGRQVSTHDDYPVGLGFEEAGPSSSPCHSHPQARGASQEQQHHPSVAGSPTPPRCGYSELWATHWGTGHMTLIFDSNHMCSKRLRGRCEKRPKWVSTDAGLIG